MSYTRSYSKSFPVPVRVHVHNPSVSTSQNGGTSVSSGSVDIEVDGHHYSIPVGAHGGGSSRDCSTSVNVNWNVLVDTDEFDRNAARCRHSVDALTGSVVATEAAEVANIRKNAMLVGQTIVDGFFKQVRSEVSTKIMEQTHVVEARLSHLATQAAELKKKQDQMTVDYQRTSARYIKIIEDLNHELENRIKNVDMPIYKFFEKVQAESNRMLDSDFVNVAATSTAESGKLVSEMQGCLLRQHAQQTLGTAQRFLFAQRRSDQIIRRSVVDMGGASGTFYLPVCFTESVRKGGASEQAFYYDNEHMTTAFKDRAMEEILAQTQNFVLTAADKAALTPYVNTLISEAFAKESSRHAQRVKDIIVKLLKA